ncbi:MAG: hypothetical protein KBT20_09725 [Bacteroidales bacterium]|nr:hypothetical protein [Candidatus Liminaster caballi]
MKNHFSKMHSWLRFLMLMFVCVSWAGPTYAQDADVSINFQGGISYTPSGTCVTATTHSYDKGANIYCNGSDYDWNLVIASSGNNIEKIVLSGFINNWGNTDGYEYNITTDGVGSWDPDTKTWTGSAKSITFHSNGTEMDMYISGAQVWVEGGLDGSTPGSDPEPAPSLDGTPQVVSLPYLNQFETDEEKENLLAIDANEDDYKFALGNDGGNSILVLNTNSPSSVNDYVVICAANLTEGKRYNVSFKGKSPQGGWHYSGIVAGTEATAAGLNQTVLGMAMIFSTGWETFDQPEFVAPSTDTYYFAVKCWSNPNTGDLYVDDFAIEPVADDMPAAVESIDVEAGENGELSATISFNMPTATYGGDAYTSGKQLTYHIYRCQDPWSNEISGSDVEIASGNAIAGAEVSYVDEDAENGENNYGVVITDGALVGKVRKVRSPYIGSDLPASPSNAQMTVDGNRVTLTWNAPTRGQNNGYLGTVTYNVYPYKNYTEGSVINNAPITETTYSFDYDLNSGEQGELKFAIKAVTSAGSSSATYTPNAISVGAPYTLPFNVDFSTSSNRYKYEGTNCWGGESNSEYDMYTWVGNEALNFITGKIDFAGSNAQLSFDYKADASNITFDVIVLDQNGNENQIETISNPTDSYQRAVVDFTGDYKNDNWVKVMIRVNLKGAYYHAYFDNLSIIAKAPTYAVTVNPSIANGTVTADKTEAEAGETVTLTATPAVGYQFGSWAVTTTAGGTPVAVANNQFTMPAEAVTVSATFDQKPPINDNYSNALTSQALFDEFTVIDANNDGVKWIFADGQARIQWNSTQAMNDYLVTPGITISGGNYRLSVDMREYGVRYPEKFEIVYGTAPTADALTTQIIGVTTPTASDVTYSQEFEISTPGVYYFAIHGVSDRDEWYLYAKNFVLEKIVPPVKYAVTVNPSIANGTVTADKSEAEAGETVTLTATPASGYKLSAWNVVDANSNNIPVTNNTFTMPESDVTVSATFVEVGNVIEIDFDFTSNTSNTITHDPVTATYYRSGSGGSFYAVVGTLYDNLVFTSDAGKIVEIHLTCNSPSMLSSNPSGYNSTTGVWESAEGAETVTFSCTGGLFDAVSVTSATVIIEGSEAPTPAPTYAVTIGSHENGTLSTDVTEAEEGATVNVTATPNEGYELTSITVNGEAIVGSSFTMPAEDVTVAAVFNAINYTITVSDAIANGSVEVVGDVTTATIGTVITLVPSAEDGYVFKSWNVRRDDTQATITVTDNQFTMPAANVTISATFGEPTPEYDGSNSANLTLIAQDNEGKYWATFSSTSDVVIIGTEDVYAVTLDADMIALSSYDELKPIGASGFEGIHVPANTGVLLKADVNTVSYMPVSNYQFGAAPANLLKPASEAMTGDYKFYKLAYDDYTNKTGLGFYFGAADGAAFYAKEGGAYLAIPNSSAASLVHGFSFEDLENGTGIMNVEATENATSYDLNGLRVNENYKGLIIRNGKKILSK